MANFSIINNDNVANNACFSSKTNNISNIDKDKTNDTLNNANVTTRSKKPNKKINNNHDNDNK